MKQIHAPSLRATLYRWPLMAAPVFDGRLVTLGGPLDGLLRAETGPVQDHGDGADGEGEVKHPPDHRTNPRQGPALILIPAGRGRTFVQLRDQFAHQFRRQHRIRARRALGRQGVFTTRDPGPPPRVRRFGGDLQLGGDLRHRHPVAEHLRRLPAYLFTPCASLRTDPTAVPVSHALSTHADQTGGNHTNQRYARKSDPDQGTSVNAYRHPPETSLVSHSLRPA